jgi:MinD superfamily P-loop ATPase
MTTLGVFSARADGATTVAVGLAAVLAARSRTLLIDLNLDNPEIATILDLDPEVGIYDLAYKAQLAPVDRDELEEHTGYRDRIAVLPGVSRWDDVGRITPHFLTGLLDAATRRYEHVVIDLGRMPALLAAAAEAMRLLWVVTPTPRGTAALERRYWEAEREGAAWLKRPALVVNRHSERAFIGFERYAAGEYEFSTAGTVPDAADYWMRVELGHSVEALNIAEAHTADPRYEKHHGAQALATRRAFEALAESLAPIELASAETR